MKIKGPLVGGGRLGLYWRFAFATHELATHHAAAAHARNHSPMKLAFSSNAYMSFD